MYGYRQYQHHASKLFILETISFVESSTVIFNYSIYVADITYSFVCIWQFHSKFVSRLNPRKTKLASL